MATVHGRSYIGCFKVVNVYYVQSMVQSWIEMRGLKLTISWSNYEGYEYAVLIVSGSKSARARLEDYCDGLSSSDGIVAEWFAMKKAERESR